MRPGRLKSAVGDDRILDRVIIVPLDQTLSNFPAQAGAGEDDDDDSAGPSPDLGLRRLVRLVKRGGDLLCSRVGGLSGFEWRVMTEVCNAPGQSINDLGKKCDRSVAQVSRTVKHLAVLGFLDRRNVPGGPRIAVDLTPSGLDQMKVLSSAYEGMEQNLKVGISDMDFATFERVAAVMTRNALYSLSGENILPYRHKSAR